MRVVGCGEKGLASVREEAAGSDRKKRRRRSRGSEQWNA